MIVRFIILLSALLLSGCVGAAEVQFGIKRATQSLWIKDNGAEDTIARMQSGISYSLLLAARMDAYYFSPSSNWGTFLEFGGGRFEIGDQEFMSLGDVRDVGTEVKGYQVYALPVLFYSLSNRKRSDWNLRFGLGLGAGYLDVKGSYLVSMDEHEDYGKVRRLSDSGFDMSTGIYLELTFGKHSIIVQDYGPSLYTESVELHMFNTTMSYRYSIYQL